MTSDFEIGRVVTIDTAQVSIELNRDLKGMSRNTYEGSHEIGRINSYVILPVGVRRLVAIITRVILVEDMEMKAGQKAIALPASRRVMKATLIGTIDGSIFRQGISDFPVLDNPVHLAGQADLDAIFGPTEHSSKTMSESEMTKFSIPIGESTAVRGRPIRIDPDAFFGKHAAILGSTGSGKSCTIASLLQSIHEQPQVKRTTCIILDTNGEYRTALQGQKAANSKNNAIPRKILHIPSNPEKNSERLMIPYWFMNADDFARLFQTSKGVQRPVLLEALRLARNDTANASAAWVLREELVHEANRIWSLSGQEKKTSKDILKLAEGLKKFIAERDLHEVWDEIESQYNLTRANVQNAISEVASIAKECIDNGWPTPIPADAKQAIRSNMDFICEKLTGTSLGEHHPRIGRSADIPSYFDRFKFRSRHIEQVLRREEAGGARARDFSGTMLLRIDRLLADQRFDFLFGPIAQILPNPKHALASFLRDMLGIGASEVAELSTEADVPKSWMPFYDRQRDKGHPADVVILDLSLLAAEVLENVTALVGRLVLEFLQRLGEHGGEETRGSLPVALVLEEAQNYIQQPRFAGEESIAQAVFERIAREGRKYGLSLIVASQRPSELSKTVLSQCNSFIVHRLQNPEDLRYFREIVPSIYGPMLEQIPALAPQTALVLGECVPAPATIKVREASPTPRSRDPKFYHYWTSDNPPYIDVEDICRKWEGEDTPDNEGAPTPNSSNSTE